MDSTWSYNHLKIILDIVFFGESLPERFVKLAMKVIYLITWHTIVLQKVGLS